MGGLRRAAAVVALAGLTSLVAAAVDSPAASATEFETYQWNMSGLEPRTQPDSGHGNALVAAEALAKIDAHQPLVVSLNEVCSNQFYWLKPRLESKGYSYVVWKAREDWLGDDDDAGRCTWFGDVVFVKGAPVGGHAEALSPNLKPWFVEARLPVRRADRLQPRVGKRGDVVRLV